MPPRTRDAPQKKCWNCGQTDHCTSECSSSERLCFNCQEPGHESSLCPKPRGVVNARCRGCGEKGHLSEDCTTRSEWVCKNCEKIGHGQWECPKPRGYLWMMCRLCEEVGHLAKECSNRTNLTCPNCTEKGHSPRQCPKPPGYDEMTCDFCEQPGHSAHECTNVSKWKCKRCKEIGHLHMECSNVRGYLNVKCHGCQEIGHVVSECPNRTCFKCGAKGHTSRACPLQNFYSCYVCGSRQHGNGQCLRDKGDTIPARKTLITDIKDPRKLWRLGLIAIETKEYAEAVTLLTSAIALDTTSPAYIVSRGIAHAKLHNYTAARADFLCASTLDGYKPTISILLHIARCRLALDSPSSALSAIEEALALDPTDKYARALERRVIHIRSYLDSRSRQSLDEQKNSYRSCREICTQEDDVPPVYVRCWGIELRISEGDWDTATVDADYNLRQDSTSLPAMIMRARILFLTGKLSEATDQILEALKSDPDCERAKVLWRKIKRVRDYKDEGKARFVGGKWESAVQAYTEALDCIDDDLEEGRGGLIFAILLINRATCYCKLNRFSDGLQDTETSLTLHPTYHKALLVRARINVVSENYICAIDDLKALLRSDSSSMSSRAVQALKSKLRVAELLIKDHYVTLGLKPKCSASEIRSAYLAMLRKHRPDQGGNVERLKLVTCAYEILSNESTRKGYDWQRLTQNLNFDSDLGAFRNDWHWP